MSAAPAEAVAIPREVERARERIAGLGGVEAHSACGGQVDHLTLHSASLDLLVVGSRGYGPLGRLVYGGVAQRPTRTARCPLLVLTRSARTAADDAEATVKQRQHVGRDLLDGAPVRTGS
jgi:nucleotide-binding universal stress UspA family protein